MPPLPAGAGGGAGGPCGGGGGLWRRGGPGHTLALGGAAASAAGRARALRAVARGRQLIRRRPGLAKVAATAVGFAGGDVLTQRLNRRLADGSERAHDYAKTAAMLAVGAALAGPAGLLIFRLCDAAAAPAAAGAALAAGKFAADQVVGCAIWQAAYCAICPWYRDIVVGALRSVAPAGLGRRRGAGAVAGAPAAPAIAPAAAPAF